MSALFIMCVNNFTIQGHSPECGRAVQMKYLSQVLLFNQQVCECFPFRIKQTEHSDFKSEKHNYTNGRMYVCITCLTFFQEYSPSASTYIDGQRIKVNEDDALTFAFEIFNQKDASRVSYPTLALYVHIASYISYTWQCVISSCPSRKTHTLSQSAFLKHCLYNAKYAIYNVP